MDKLKNFLISLVKKNFDGKKKYQRLFNLSYILSTQGLNYGNGGSIEISGEISLIKNLAAKYAKDTSYIIFDVGANRGDYTTELLKYINAKNLQVWCFEPSSSAFEHLQLLFNGINNVHLNNLGISHENKMAPLYTDQPGALIASLFPLERAYGASGQLESFEMVRVATIDDFMAKNNIPYIDLLKLDIEGNELNALLGSKQALKKGIIKAIQFEFGACNIDSRTYFRDFWNLLSPQYNLYRILKDGLQPITQYSEYNEIFATINYYAELK